METKITIYQQRIKKNVSLRELSQKTGISRSTLNRYENGKTQPGILDLEKIAIALNLRITDLFQSDFK